MAKQRQAEIELAFYEFCLHWIEPAFQSQHEDDLYVDWVRLGRTKQEATFEQIKNIRDALIIRGQYESGISAVEQLLDQEPGPSDAERLDFLNTLDDFITSSHEQAEKAFEMLGVLKTDLLEWQHVPPQAIMWSLTLWERDAAHKMQNKEDYAGRRAELHELLRNTPGRKIVVNRPALVSALEDQAQEQANRLPSIPQPRTPRNFRYIEDKRHLGCCWELKTFKDNIGGMNEGIDLMCGVNQFGTIVQRAVQKRLMPSQENDPSEWCGDLKFGRTRPILKEYVTQVVASEASGARNILRPLREPLDRGNGEWGLYLEYAPHGDLEAVVTGHVGEGNEVPEAFLWLLFQSLIESVLIMKRGVLNGASPGDWREIVHRDWKLGNICLGLPDSNHFPQYPRPLVADFGFAIFTEEANDPINPDYWVGSGTPGCFPPEGKRYIDPDTRKVVDGFQMLSASNVWGIGLCMYTLMTQRFLDRETQPPYAIKSPPDHDPNDNEIFGYKFEGHLPFTYTQELCDVVEQCLEFHPDERPSIEDLKKWVDDWLNRQGTPLRTMHLGSSWDRAEELLCRPEKERYKMGMTWNASVTPDELDRSEFAEDEVDDEDMEDGLESDWDAEQEDDDVTDI